jgi:hypothetical protein
VSKRKLVSDLEEKTWKTFVRYCKIKNQLVGKELTKIIKKHLEKENIKITEEIK